VIRPLYRQRRSCVSVEEQRDMMRGEVTALRLAVSQETFEKDAARKSCSDLRVDVKRLEAVKTELTGIIRESKQKISGKMIETFIYL